MQEKSEKSANGAKKSKNSAPQVVTLSWHDDHAAACKFFRETGLPAKFVITVLLIRVNCNHSELHKKLLSVSCGFLCSQYSTINVQKTEH